MSPEQLAFEVVAYFVDGEGLTEGFDDWQHLAQKFGASAEEVSQALVKADRSIQLDWLYPSCRYHATDHGRAMVHEHRCRKARAVANAALAAMGL